ncbi:MAG: YcjF family protein [Synechococcales cyanobacterium RU_4_20]|nr:YcjF family protein [Synechococcales cyanobacterium RU_4_20]
MQSREIEQAIARKTVDLRREEAEALIWKFARAKGIAIAANPVALLDLLGGAVTDLALIRALANLYGLPMTSYEAGALWRKIILSSGALLLTELGSGLLLGLGKGAAALSSLENPRGSWPMAPRRSPRAASGATAPMSSDGLPRSI